MNISINKPRLLWIDATKGLLVLLMVLGHISNISGNYGIDNGYLSKCIFFSSLYTCFFMQAFIILSGYTSNYDKEFKPFVISLVKTILVPWIAFSLLTQLFRVLVLGADILFITIDNQRFLFFLEDFWFLHVLFVGKIIYYFIYKFVKKDLFRSIICLLLMILGFLLFSRSYSIGHNYHYFNYLHYKDMLCMVFFLWLGNFFKRKNVIENIKGKYLALIIFMYLLGHAIRLYLRLKGLDNLFITPVVISHSSNIQSIVQIPTFLYYVILGSLSCFGIMQYIKKSKLLEFFGKNSLVVYCSHFILLYTIIFLIKSIIEPTNIVWAIGYTLIVFIICLLLCFVFIKLSYRKPFNYLVGKF